MTSAPGNPSGSRGLPDDPELAGRARDLLKEIASQPRFAGSESEKRARQLCGALLEAQGMTVSEREFAFSAFPGRYGAPLIGFLWLVTALLTRHAYLRHGGAGPATAILISGLAVSGVLGKWLTRDGTGRFRWMKSRSSNLIATRGQPEIWLVAHLDSKSQTIPMIARIFCLVAAVTAFALLSLALTLEWMGVSVHAGSGNSSTAPLLAMIAAATTVPVILCLVRDNSPGAVDNASGVIAVILATTLLRSQADLGVILTSGEELGLAGARAHVETHTDRAIAINCDTVDDGGRFLCMARRTSRGAATAAIVRAAKRVGLPLRVRGIIPGILADSIAFADAGWDSLTLSRGNIATLARVHTSSDTRERLNGAGIAQAAYLLAATVEELR
jgi:hypothetical protein